MRVKLNAQCVLMSEFNTEDLMCGGRALKHKVILQLSEAITRDLSCQLGGELFLTSITWRRVPPSASDIPPFRTPKEGGGGVVGLPFRGSSERAAKHHAALVAGALSRDSWSFLPYPYLF
jgi:hypothetical protein